MRQPRPANIMAESNGIFPYLPSGANEVNQLIREHGDLFSDSQCRVCSAVLISESQKLAHYQSKKHESKVRRYMSVHGNEEPLSKRFKPTKEPQAQVTAGIDQNKACPVCNMEFSSPVVAQSHYQGKVHSKNLRMKSLGPALLASPQPKAFVKKNGGNAGSGLQDPDRFCSICKASFNNPLMAQQHYVGKKHKKHLTKQKLMETFGPSAAPASTVKGYPCTVCNIELNSVEQYQAHISGSKHKNHVKLKKGGNEVMSPPENYQPDFTYGAGPDGAEVAGEWDSFSQDFM